MAEDEDQPTEPEQSQSPTVFVFTVEYDESHTTELVSETEDEAIAEVANYSEDNPTVTHTREIAPYPTTEEPLVKVTFHAQSPTGRVEFPRRQTVFYVPYSDASDVDGSLYENNSYDSDTLRYHDRAPNWIEEWDNPFFITIDRLNSHTRD